MPRLEVSLLGPFGVRLDGEPLTAFHSDKVRALLAYLATEADYPEGHLRRPHRRESLAGLLWPDYPERSARTNLSNALSHLRTALRDRDWADAEDGHSDTEGGHRGPPLLLVEREGVQLNPEADCWADVTTFSHLVEADPSAAASDAETSAAARRLAEGVTLYRGPFLEGFSLPDSPLFEQWTLVTRERLQRQMIEALERLGAYREQRGEVEQALAYARRQLEIEPGQESAHQAVMRLLALGGDRSAALAQYEACVRALKEELDVEPSEETVALYERIRDGAIQREARSGGETGVLKHNLPAQLTPFVGRAGTLAEIAERLDDPACRLLTLVGPGGSGKTRLALEAAARRLDHYAHGVFFVSLAPLQSVEAVVPTVAQALGFALRGEGEPRQQLLDYLRRKQVLLVLDNYEHLLARPDSRPGGGVGLVTGVLRTAPDVSILVTSRVRLNVQGEHLFSVGGMDYPETLPQATTDADRSATQSTHSVRDASRYSAVQLFLSSTRRVKPDYELSSEDLSHVVRICHLVGGMPLGILLAAAWIVMLTPSEIAAEISRSLDFLQTDLRDVPERHTSIRAVFDHSWNLLSEQEQQVLAGLSVFRGGCTREAAQEVSGASLRELMALVTWSLLHRAPTPSTVLQAPVDLARDRPPSTEGRYEMHEMLRQYAAEKLAGSPDGGEAVRDRHAAYYAAALQQWVADLKGARQQAALAEIEADVENARAAWEWAAAQGQVEALARAADGLAVFYDWRGRYQEGEAAFRAAADRLAAMEEGTPAGSVGRLGARIRVLGWQGRFCQQLGHTERAKDLLYQSLGLLEGAASAVPTDRAGCPQDVRHEKAFLLWAMGEIEHWSGSRDQARQRYEQSLAIYRTLNDRWWTANALYGLATAAQATGAYEEAENLHQEALAIRRALGDQRGVVHSLLDLAFALMDQGRLAEAERLAREGIAVSRAIGDRAAIVEGAMHLGATLKWQGRAVESYPLLEECAAIAHDLGSVRSLRYVEAQMGWIEWALGHHEQARALWQRCLGYARALDDRWEIGIRLLCLSNIALEEGNYVEAMGLLQESVPLLREGGYRGETSDALATLGLTALLLGDRRQARGHLSEALRIEAEAHSAIWVRGVLEASALFLADRGEVERAVEIHALVAREPWSERLIGRRIAAAAATLPPDVVATAQARGRARDLWATVEELLADFVLYSDE